MNCDKYNEWLSAALDGELTAQQRRELDAHLAQCPDCAALLETLSANSRAMRELDCEFPEGLHARMMGSLPPQTAPAKKNNLIRLRRWGTLAACLVVVATAALAAAPSLSRQKAGAPAAPDAEYSINSVNEEHAPGGAAPIPPASTGSKEGDPASPQTAPSTNAPYAESEAPGTSVVPESILPSRSPTPIPSNSGSAPSRFPGSDTNLPVIQLLSPEETRYIRVAYGQTPRPSALILSSPASLEAYLNTFGSGRHDGKGDPIPNEALEALKETYTEDFFTDRCLLAVVVESGSGSTRYEVLSTDGSSVTIRVITPEMGTCDMAAWLIIAPLNGVLDDGSELKIDFVH